MHRLISTNYCDDPINWPVSLVSGWLIEIGLKNYTKIFTDSNINGCVLLSELSDETSLKSLIPNDEDRNIFIRSLENLRSKTSISSTLNVNSTLGIPLSSSKYTLSVKQGDTLEKIAVTENIPLAALKGANPTLQATQELNRDQKIYLPVIQKLITETSSMKSANNPVTIPETFHADQLTVYKEKLREFFLIADSEQNDSLNIAEFKWLLKYLNLKILDDDQIYNIYRDVNGNQDGEVVFDDLFRYFYSLIVMENDLNSTQTSLFQAMLTADHLNECLLGGITQYMNQTWSKFSHFKRYGQNGQLVMTSGENIAVIQEGDYSLVDLICWQDHLTEFIQPKHAIVKKFKWRSKSEFGPDAKDGELIFPAQFDPHLPIEIATVQNLKYYGCGLANETQLKVSLLHRHEIVDFKYFPNYETDFVQSVNHPGLERHGFGHLDCPHNDHFESGYFILGKIVNNDELHLTAFIIPTRHTLYVPPYTIHSNDYLRGTWRTMLADADIDRVVLKKGTPDGSPPKIFSFEFVNR